MVSPTLSTVRSTRTRFTPCTVAIPQGYLLANWSTPKHVWGVSDWIKTVSGTTMHLNEQFSEDRLRHIQVSAENNLVDFESVRKHFLFLGLPQICGKALSVEALQEPPFPGWPRVVISKNARGLPCLSDCGKRSWYFMRTGEENWFLNDSHFPKLRNVVQCAILQFLKSGDRIPNESSKIPYVCARDDADNLTTLTVGFKGDELHVALFTDDQHGY